MLIVGTDPKVVAFAPIIVSKHLVAINTYGIKVFDTALAHRTFRCVFQIAGD
jgi:hypothetical protein